MTTEYRASVWLRAMKDAEAEVMRCTATPLGGRHDKESLMAYVERAKSLQDAAIARWMTAKAEYEAAAKDTP